MAQKAEAPHAPIELGQAEVDALVGGKREAMRAWSRRLRAATPSNAPAEGAKTEKLAPVPITRSELRALAAGKPMPAAVKKRLDAAASKAREIEKREAAKEETDQPTREPYR